MNHYTVGKYQRISKATAKKEYMQGKTIAFCPCKVNPENKWIIPYCVNRQQRQDYVIDDIGALNDFIALVNSYEYYNCQYNETGKYCAFYRLLA